MEIDLKAVDIFINEILKDFDNNYNLAMHAILLESIKEIGLNKNDLIEKLSEAVDDEELIKLCNSSFVNKISLKKFIPLKKEERTQIINKLIERIKKCDEKEGKIIIPERPKLLDNKKEEKVEETYLFEFNDPELGNIKIEESGSDGIINSDNIKIKKCRYNYKIPIVFEGIDEFIIRDLINHQNEFDGKKYINNLKILLNSEEYIIKKIILYVINFFEEGNDQEDFIRINISATARAYYDQDDSIDISISFSFEEETDEMDGYIDTCFNCNMKELEHIEEGFY